MTDDKYITLKSSLLKNVNLLLSLMHRVHLNDTYYNNLTTNNKEYKELVTIALQTKPYMFWSDYACVFKRTWFFNAPNECTFILKDDCVKAYSSQLGNITLMQYEDFCSRTVYSVVNERYKKIRYNCKSVVNLFHETLGRYSLIYWNNKELSDTLNDFYSYTKDIDTKDKFSFDIMYNKLNNIKEIINTNKKIDGTVYVAKHYIPTKNIWVKNEKSYMVDNINTLPSFVWKNVLLKKSEKEIDNETKLGKEIINNCIKWIYNMYMQQLNTYDFYDISEENLYKIDNALHHLYIKDSTDTLFHYEKKSYTPFIYLYLNTNDEDYSMHAIKQYTINKVKENYFANTKNIQECINNFNKM